MITRRGVLFLVSGPSGSGKTTLCRRISDENEAHYSISCTTRQPREGEQDHRDYHFLSREAFDEKINHGDFLEYATVYRNSYGTLKSEVLSYLVKGEDVVLDIDVQGAAKVRSCSEPMIRDSLVDLFVTPPSEEELRNRLTSRGTDAYEIIALRMKNALDEMSHWYEYQYRLLSSTRDQDYAQFKALLIAERLRVNRIIKP
jgi:guanylate kinase